MNTSAEYRASNMVFNFDLGHDLNHEVLRSIFYVSVLFAISLQKSSDCLEPKYEKQLHIRP